MKLFNNFFVIGDGIGERLPNGLMVYVGKKPQYEDLIKAFGANSELISKPKKKDSK